MKQPQRIFVSILVTIAVGIMSAFSAVQKNNRDYQEHPVACLIGSVIVSPLAGIIVYWSSGWLVGHKRKELVQEPNSRLSKRKKKKNTNKTNPASFILVSIVAR